MHQNTTHCEAGTETVWRGSWSSDPRTEFTQNNCKTDNEMNCSGSFLRKQKEMASDVQDKRNFGVKIGARRACKVAKLT